MACPHEIDRPKLWLLYLLAFETEVGKIENRWIVVREIRNESQQSHFDPSNQ